MNQVGSVLAGATILVPHFCLKNILTTNKVKIFIGQYYGALSGGVLSYQIDIIKSRPTTRISLAANAGLCALVTRFSDKYPHNISALWAFKITYMAMGALACARGDRAFGVSALLSTALTCVL